jgi:hypothetical protein
MRKFIAWFVADQRFVWNWWACNLVHSWRHWTYTPMHKSFQVRCDKCGRKWMMFD